LQVFDALLKLKMGVSEGKVLTEQLTALEQRHREERHKLMAMAVDEREATILRQHIVDEILTLRCPRKTCRQAFVDFDGCFALTCGNKQCNAGFCAWCLKDCGGDAHSHVANCPDNPTRQVYDNFQAFEAHHRGRKASLVRVELNKKDRKVREMTLEMLEKDLKDLNIRL
jgi:hypothetical protein